MSEFAARLLNRIDRLEADLKTLREMNASIEEDRDNWQRGTLEQGEVIVQLKEERDAILCYNAAQVSTIAELRELVREAHDHIGDNCYWTDWLERAEKALEGK
jgi:hypothetical protein